MKPTTRKPAATKPVVIIARYFIKRTKAVVYACRGSHGEVHYTTVINGRATGCTCPARKPCKHMDRCQALEQSRIAQANEQAATGDRSFVEAVLDKAYAVRAQEITEQGTLHHSREIVAPLGTSSSEAVLAARGWMR